jgi:hypothetical protein
VTFWNLLPWPTRSQTSCYIDRDSHATHHGLDPMERRPPFPSPGSAPLNKHPSDAKAALHLQYRSPHHMYFDSKPLRSGESLGNPCGDIKAISWGRLGPCAPASPYLLGVYLLYRSSLPHQTVLQRSGTVRRSHGLTSLRMKGSIFVNEQATFTDTHATIKHPPTS